jgi:hypothetical protein
MKFTAVLIPAALALTLAVGLAPAQALRVACREQLLAELQDTFLGTTHCSERAQAVSSVATRRISTSGKQRMVAAETTTCANRTRQRSLGWPSSGGFPD